MKISIISESEKEKPDFRLIERKQKELKEVVLRAMKMKKSFHDFLQYLNIYE
jgi:hypothetical protein